jgi:hypothetical protein
MGRHDARGLLGSARRVLRAKSSRVVVRKPLPRGKTRRLRRTREGCRNAVKRGWGSGRVAFPSLFPLSTACKEHTTEHLLGSSSRAQYEPLRSADDIQAGYGVAIVVIEVGGRDSSVYKERSKQLEYRPDQQENININNSF